MSQPHPISSGSHELNTLLRDPGLVHTHNTTQHNTSQHCTVHSAQCTHTHVPALTLLLYPLPPLPHISNNASSPTSMATHTMRLASPGLVPSPSSTPAVCAMEIATASSHFAALRLRCRGALLAWTFDRCDGGGGDVSIVLSPWGSYSMINCFEHGTLRTEPRLLCPAVF